MGTDIHAEKYRNWTGTTRPVITKQLTTPTTDYKVDLKIVCFDSFFLLGIRDGYSDYTFGFFVVEGSC